ncbi:aminoglycoside 3-N-acetyltransferase [Haladaptatus litoreus]|uniref:Aminoglycoside 3-N-acetyltransferase n=1 Tax=Haladaptatus litoreus TaxID=553468 RepID=A0A1N6VLG9_9EURY|nr:AAC(3) family N-acetyltransferase [Haladaptatus litoreus]SIQ78711.1 aminoglycoside 3-N-acetyltransferase [Haladaptatus litoreus]
MSEQDIIEQSDEPITGERIADDLRTLGISAGDTLLVHSSLSALGWVSGGAPAVVDALRSVVTTDGTLVMPTHTGLSDPDGWQNPPVPDDWEETIRATMSPYRPEVTPTRGMGAIPETFRSYPDVVRSKHPQVSFSAWGTDAESIVADHEYDFGLGENSPLADVYDRDGTVLLLGAGYDSNTSIHLAEHRGEFQKETESGGAPVLEDGEREWIRLTELALSDDDFEQVGEVFETERPEAVARGSVGNADTVAMRQRELVDFASDWFSENR